MHGSSIGLRALPIAGISRLTINAMMPSDVSNSTKVKPDVRRVDSMATPFLSRRGGFAVA